MKFNMIKDSHGSHSHGSQCPRFKYTVIKKCTNQICNYYTLCPLVRIEPTKFDIINFLQNNTKGLI